MCCRRASAARRFRSAEVRESRLKPGKRSRASGCGYRPADRGRGRRHRCRRAGNVPRVGRSRQPRMFIRVDLPEPLEPMNATNSPRCDLERDAAHGMHFHFAGAVGLVDVFQPERLRRSADSRSCARNRAPAAAEWIGRPEWPAPLVLRCGGDDRDRLPSILRVTSVTMPSLIPVLICHLGFGLAPARRKPCARSRRSGDPPPVPAGPALPSIRPPAASAARGRGGRRSHPADETQGARSLIFNTSSRCATTMETFAVMPGFNFKSGLLTPMTVS